jgi:hypothetical protein
MHKVDIAELRPTQMTHGQREVQQKIDVYAQLNDHDLAMAIAEKPIPLVLGPGATPFAIDHHHVATALWRVNVKDVPFVLVRDLSSLSLPEFWLTLENQRWTYPYNASGKRVPFGEMHRHIWELEDDVYRSVSAFVRDAGGYEKTSVPLEEFRWADFFRSQLSAPQNDNDFDALVRDGLRLAKSKVASGLPGYLG